MNSPLLMDFEKIRIVKLKVSEEHNLEEDANVGCKNYERHYEYHEVREAVNKKKSQTSDTVTCSKIWLTPPLPPPRK